MSDRITQHLDCSFGLYGDLIESLPADALDKKLPDLPSSPIGNQLWCVVGTRELRKGDRGRRGMPCASA